MSAVRQEEEATSSPWLRRLGAPEFWRPSQPSRTPAPLEPAGLRGLPPPEDAPPSLVTTIGPGKHEHCHVPSLRRRVRPPQAIWPRVVSPLPPSSSSPRASA